MNKPHWLQDIEHWFTRSQFGLDRRRRLYTTLSMLLANNVMLSEALDEMYAVYSQNGKKPKTVEALVLADVKGLVAEGKPFHEAIRRWTSSEEAAVIEAGEQAGRLRFAFDDSLQLIDGNSKLRSAVVFGVAYPTALFGVLSILLHIVATRLAPALMSVAPPEMWTGAARLMYLLSMYVTHFGVATIITFVIVLVAFFYSLPRLTGNIRYHLDKFVLYAIYRHVNGAMYLKNIAVMVHSGIKLHDALHTLKRTATPYMRERIDATILGTTRGLNLGEALDSAQYDFPDREAIQYLKVLANRDGFDRALSSFAEERMGATIGRVQLSMRLFFFIAIVAVGACGAMIVVAGIDIQDAIEATFTR